MADHTLPCARSQPGSSTGIAYSVMFQVLKLDEIGNRHHVQFLPTLEAAKQTVQSLHENWPGNYLIVDQATRETTEITGESKQHQP
jgi:hypothetical protein